MTKIEHRLLIVRLRLGGSTFTRISKLTGISYMTCYNVWLRYKSRKTIEEATRVGRPLQKLPDDVHEYLSNNLEDDRFLSLRQRVKIIKQKFNFPISLTKLRNFYLRNDIKYRLAPL